MGKRKVEQPPVKEGEVLVRGRKHRRLVAIAQGLTKHTRDPDTRCVWSDGGNRLFDCGMKHWLRIRRQCQILNNTEAAA